MCKRVGKMLPSLSREIVRQIRADIPGYGVVPAREHPEFVMSQAHQLLDGVARQSVPNAEQVEQARELGRRRAGQELPIEMLLGAYHITYREIWNALLGQATAEDHAHVAHLAHVVNLIWDWMRLVTSAASDAYGEEMQRTRVRQSNLTHQLFAALMSAEPSMPLAANLAQALGYFHDEVFQALCMPAEDWPEDRIDGLQRGLAELPGQQRCATIGSITLVLGQGQNVDTTLTTIRRIQDEASPIGIGLRRPGLEGAMDSITDAAQALELARPGETTVWFADEWLTASLGTQSARLAPLLTSAARTAETHPHLAEAVIAFADHGLSVAAAARSIHLHSNSLAYRLTRWHQLSGWDPRSGDGLIASHVALRLYTRGENGA